MHSLKCVFNEKDRLQMNFVIVCIALNFHERADPIPALCIRSLPERYLKHHEVDSIVCVGTISVKDKCKEEVSTGASPCF